jgi:arylsulfatase A-like enzyme
VFTCSWVRADGQSAPRSGFAVCLGSKEPYYDTQKEYEKFPLGPNVSDMELDEDAVTIAEALKPLGYVSAHVGKRHMRDDPGKEGYVLHDGATTNNEGSTLKANLKPGEPTPKRLTKDMSDAKLMFSITEKAIGFMEEQVKKRSALDFRR